MNQNIIIQSLKAASNVKQLRISHFPQIPCGPFQYVINNEFEAYHVVNALALQHLWLFENDFIPDYANVINVEIYNEKEKEWEDYEIEIESYFYNWDEIYEEIEEHLNKEI